MSEQCENIAPSLSHYWFEARIVNTRCRNQAEWEVQINPGKPKKLCDFCSRLDYPYRNRAAITKATT